MFCHQCGAAIEHADDRFCSRCGVPLHRGGAPEPPAAGLQPPPGEAMPDRHRRPISAWPEHPRERIQLPLTELRQRRSRETAEQVPLPVVLPALAAAPPPPPVEIAPAEAPELPALETVETGGAPEEPPSTSRTRAEEALRRMVPPKDEWAAGDRPAPAERVGVREEWAAPREEVKAPAPEPAVAAAPVAAAAAPPEAAPAPDDPIIPWLAPPVAAALPARPAPPSQEAKAEEGPIIVPRDYDENAGRGRRGRRRTGKGKRPLVDLNALGRSIRPSWILAIAAVILLTLIVFAIFPPGGASGDAAGSSGVNRFTGMPIHTVATPARPTPGTPAVPETTEATASPLTTDTPWETGTAPPATSRQAPIFGVLPGVTLKGTTVAPQATPTALETGASGLRVVISSAGGWSGTIGQQGETYTETPVVGSGDQVRTITGPASMVTVDLRKLDDNTGPLEVRVERDGAVLKSASTTEPSGIVVLSVQV